MAIPWSFAFNVPTTSDFETRYQEVLSVHPVPTSVVPDLAIAHDMAVEMIANHGIQLPLYASFSGSVDPDNVRTNITVNVQQAS
jgi:hypothetical protein